MGPTNVALVKLFQIDQRLHEAQERLDAVMKNVRIQERRTNELNEKLQAMRDRLRELQTKSGALELDLKTRDAHIEKLRFQQQTAKTNKEYQVFLVEISTAKVDKNKVEDETIKVMESVERAQKELEELSKQVESERAKLQTMKGEIGGRASELEQEIAQIRPERDQAAAAVPAKAVEVYNRIAERYEGEGMSAIAKPDRRVEEYVCTTCNMDLVADIYNKLHSRDELVYCPSCRRILYIPDDLPPELAVNKPKEKKERPVKAPPAAVGRQTSAVDVMKSINADEGESSPSESAQSS